MLEANASVISGSFVLKWMDPTSNWQVKDLDIYTPYDEFLPVIVYLINVEGYAIDWDVVTNRMDQDIVNRIEFGDRARVSSLLEDFYVSRPGESAINVVLTLVKGNRFIDVIQNKGPSALHAISQFTSTLQMNYISANEFCCPYPSQTLNKVGILNGSSLDENGLPRPFVYPFLARYIQ